MTKKQTDAVRKKLQDKRRALVAAYVTNKNYGRDTEDASEQHESVLRTTRHRLRPKCGRWARPEGIPVHGRSTVEQPADMLPCHGPSSHLRLLHGEHAIHSEVLEPLLSPTGPSDRESLDLHCGRDSEVNPAIVLRQIS